MGRMISRLRDAGEREPVCKKKGTDTRWIWLNRQSQIEEEEEEEEEKEETGGSCNVGELNTYQQILYLGGEMLVRK